MPFKQGFKDPTDFKPQINVVLMMDKISDNKYIIGMRTLLGRGIPGTQATGSPTLLQDIKSSHS